MKKKTVISSLFALILTLPLAHAPVQAAITPVEIQVNGKVLSTDQAAFNDDGTVFVPIRHLAEALGGTATWDNTSRIATVTIGNKKIDFEIGKDIATVNNERLRMSGSTQIVGERTMVPIRFIGEHVGGEVKWDQAKHAVIIDTRSAPLFDAIRAGDVRKVTELLNDGLNPNAIQLQKSALFTAIESEELEIARLLLQKGVDPYGATNLQMPTALHEAVTRADVRAVELLLSAVKSPTFEQKFNQESALYYAVLHNRNSIVKVMLEHGVNPNIPTILESYQNSPDDRPDNELLLYAVRQNNTEMVADLLAAKADPNVLFESEMPTILHHAAYFNMDTNIRTLKRYQADPNRTTKQGWTPLMIAAERGHTAAVQALIESGAQLDLQNALGANAYLIAKTHGNEATMKLLAAAGADTAYSPKLSDDAVHFRKHTTHFQEDDTELMRAAYIGQTGLVRALIEGGANPNALSVNGSAINYASGYTETVKAILSAPSFTDEESKNNALNTAIDGRNVELATALLQAGAKSTYQTYNLALNNAPEMLDSLFKNGLDPNDGLYGTKNYGLTLASMWNQIDLVRTFLANGADPNLADEEDKTPLIHSIRRGDVNTSSLLLAKGAKVNHTDNSGHSALYYAVKRSDVAAVKLLLDAKAEVTAEIREMAKQKVAQDVLDLLPN
ncbi:ankyrin repeat domain-containing protein [Tumebacillus algifaecis]|nr:ankyrin repeat domain-containing protein [Tumebacillus algifaecis]